MKYKLFNSLLTTSASLYELPKIRKVKKYKNTVRLSFINSRNLIRKELDSFHKSALNEKCKKNFSQLFFTNSHSNAINAKPSEELPLNQKQLILSSSTPYANKSSHPSGIGSPARMYFSDISFSRNSDYLCHKRSTRSLIFQAKSMKKSTYIKSLQESQFANLIEEEKHKNLEYDYRMHNLKKDYHLLILFSNQQGQYVKYLFQIINEARTLLHERDEEKQALDKEIKQLKDKISKKQNYISKLVGYKEFLLKVKYFVSQISDIPQKELEKYGYPSFEPEKNSDSPASPTKSFSKSISKRIRKRISIIKVEQSLFKFQANKEEESVQKPIPIFLTTEEFNDHLRRIEKNTFKLFKQYNDRNEEIITMEKNRYWLPDSPKDDVLYLERLTGEKQMLIKENIKLKKVLSDLIASMKKENIKGHLTKKLKDIADNLPVNIEKDFNESNFYHLINDNSKECWIKGKKCNYNLYLIQTLEKIFLFFLLKIRQLNQSFYYKPIIQDIKKTVEKKKRIINNKRNREAKIEKRKNLHIQIIMKNTRVHLSRRGVPTNYVAPKIKKKPKNTKQLIEDLKEEYEKLLTY